MITFCKAFKMSAPNRMANTSHRVRSGLAETQSETIGYTGERDRSGGRVKRADPDGWTRCVVSQKTIDTPKVASFILTPLPGKTMRPHTAGQFIGLKVMFGEREEWRKYSLSSIVNDKNISFSVKREQRGLVSGYLFDEFAVGQEIDVYYPRGHFTLKPSMQNTKPIVFITAGVAISPTIAMVQEIQTNPALSGRSVHFIHSARTREYHAFRDVLQRLHLSDSNFKYYTAYSRDAPPNAVPQEPEATEVRYGRLTEQDLRDWLPAHRDAEVYFLGPVPFMASVKRALVKIGVPPQQLHWEYKGSLDTIDSADL